MRQVERQGRLEQCRPSSLATLMMQRVLALLEDPEELLQVRSILRLRYQVVQDCHRHFNRAAGACNKSDERFGRGAGTLHPGKGETDCMHNRQSLCDVSIKQLQFVIAGMR